MEENFNSQLQAALHDKMEWFNNERLQELVLQYRLLQTCVENIFETLSKRSSIIPDPYRLDKRITDIEVPDNTTCSDTDVPKVFGARFSDFNSMLDFICTYYRFSVEGIFTTQVKKFIDFNNFIEWDNISVANPNPNTRFFAMCINSAKSGTSNVLTSMLNENVAKSGEATKEINTILNELGQFQREVLKGELRNDLCGHPDFKKDVAYTSPEAELSEIKRLYPRVMGKRPFYNDLISEIISEDQGADKEKRREITLAKLQITGKPKQTEKKQKGNDTRDLLMLTVMAVGGFAPTLVQLHAKLTENFALLNIKKKNIFTKLVESFKKAFHIKEKEKIILVPLKDSKTGSERTQKINITTFILDLTKKENIYTGIANKGPEYNKINASSDNAILNYINKQITEIQSFFTIANALDNYFKSAVDISHRQKVRGMQIELSALHNSLINANKKRADYVTAKEEIEQMKKLGIHENE